MKFTPGGSGANSYEVQRKKASASDNTFTKIGTTNTNKFVDKKASQGQSFTYRVRANSPGGTSEWVRVTK